MQNAISLDRKLRLPDFSALKVWLHEGFWTTVSHQKDHFFLWYPVFFAFGIALYFSLYFEPPLILGLFLGGVIVAGGILLRGHNDKTPIVRGACIVAVLFVAGFSAATLRTALVYTPVLQEETGAKQITGSIREIETLEKNGGSRVVLSDVEIESIDKRHTPRLVRIRIRKDADIQVGQRISVLGALTPPSAPLYPDGFDFRRYLFFKGIGGVGFAYYAPEIIEDASPVFMNIEKLRHRIANKIMQALDPQSASIAMALIVGQKSALEDENSEAIRNSGLAHMLAISGLHVGLFSGVLFFFLRALMALFPSLTLRYPSKKIAAVFALCGACIYMLLAGATIPTQRAVLMIGIVFLAVILDRSPISLRLVAFAALVVLAISPESLLSASFHMSFAAVTGLIYFYDSTRAFWLRAYSHAGWTRKAALYFIGVCITTLIASLATAPFALYHFGQVSFVGSVANLVAVPILAFLIMPFALISLLAIPFGLEYWPLQMVGLGSQQILDIAHWASDLPHAIIRTYTWPFLAFLILVSGGLFVVLWKGWGKLLGLLCMPVAIILIQRAPLPAILIADSHDLFAFYDSSEKQLYISSFQKERFARENWEELYGLSAGAARMLPYKGAARHHGDNDGAPFYQCGEAGCRFDIGGHKVSFIRQLYATEQDCQWADVLISNAPVDFKSCPRPHIVIGKFDTWRAGAHALYIEREKDIGIKTVAQTTSGRPWSAYRNKKNNE